MKLFFEVKYQISQKELKTIGKIDSIGFKILCGVLSYFLIPIGLLNIFFYHHLVMGFMMIAFVLYCIKCVIRYPQFFFESEWNEMWAKGNAGTLRFYDDHFTRDRKLETETFSYKEIIKVCRTKDGSILLSTGGTYFLIRRRNIVIKGQQRDFDYFIQSKSGRKIRKTKYAIAEGEQESFPSDKWIQEIIENVNPKYSCRYPSDKNDVIKIVVIALKKIIIFQLFMLWFFLYDVYSFVHMYPNDIIYNGLFVILCLCAFLALLIFPLRAIRQIQNETPKEEWENLEKGHEINFYDQDIGFTCNRGFFSYDQIRKIIRKRNKFYMSVGGMPTPIKAAGMTEDSYLELYQFLKEICKENKKKSSEVTARQRIRKWFSHFSFTEVVKCVSKYEK